MVSSILGLAETLEILIEDMVSDVVEQRHLPLDEIRLWRWARLRRTHNQVKRTRWDKFTGSVREIEMGVTRGVAPLVSKKRLPDLASYDQVAQDDPFEAPPAKMEDDVWQKYLKANGLEH